MRLCTTLTILLGYIFIIFPTFSLSGQTSDMVTRGQKALKSYGIDPGPIDGILGSRTRKAIMIFQAENMLNETGILDTETQEKLGTSVRYPPKNIDASESPASPPIIEPIEIYTGETPAPESTEMSPSSALEKDVTLTEPVDSTSETVAENGNSYKHHLSRAAIMRIAVLAALGLAALRPVVWVVLTGISLILSALMFHWIESHLNSPFYLVFAVVYSTPMLLDLIVKSWDIALVFAVCLGLPFILISKYVLGADGFTAACSGLTVMTLLPPACRRMFSRRKLRRPYGMLYYRF